EATIYSRAVRHGEQADTHDVGVINIPTVEPGLDGNYVFEYAIMGGSNFDTVAARRLGEDFNLPLMAEYVQVPPAEASQGFYSVDQPNVEIVVVKPVSDTIVRGEVSAAPLDPPVNKVFVARLQEFTGKPATVKIGVPARIKSAALLSLTEDKVLQQITQIAPLTVSLKAFETATVRFEIE
ncbi:MAG TPA: hypothetical protein VHL50_09325, partial [Pyrinomonadaceae bacterium]|nr:hypothetical protein [Pyrinomonadaceae bacterium]